ncbi:hypothetical protein [Streptomyces sp. NPDC057438]|uniref:hypothetical protein n=1 Tax=Streptomyces sp. NPDC057438 TaxID=3346133 RepID=UPI00368D20E7
MVEGVHEDRISLHRRAEDFFRASGPEIVRQASAAYDAGLTVTDRTLKAWLAGTRSPTKQNLARIEDACDSFGSEGLVGGFATTLFLITRIPLEQRATRWITAAT